MIRLLFLVTSLAVSAVPLLAQEAKTDTAYDYIFSTAETMPIWPGCDTLSSQTDCKACSDHELLAFIHQHLEFRNTTRCCAKGGTSVVSFVIEKDGTVSNETLLRDADPDFFIGESVLTAVKCLSAQNIRFSPATMHGIPVAIQMNFPIRIRLE